MGLTMVPTSYNHPKNSLKPLCFFENQVEIIFHGAALEMKSLKCARVMDCYDSRNHHVVIAVVTL